MSGKKRYPWTARRIAALIGIILLLAMYGLTMVFALMGSPESKGLLMGAIFCTIAVPVLLYAMEVAARSLKGRGLPDDRKDGEPGTSESETSGSSVPSGDGKTSVNDAVSEKDPETPERSGHRKPSEQ